MGGLPEVGGPDPAGDDPAPGEVPQRAQPGTRDEGVAEPVRYPAGVGRVPRQFTPPEHGHPTEPRHPEDARYTESRWAILEQARAGYAPQPTFEPVRVDRPRIEPPRVEPPRLEPPRLEPPRGQPPQGQPTWTEPPPSSQTVRAASPWIAPARVEPPRPGPTFEPPRAEPPRAERARVEWRDSQPDADLDRITDLLRRDVGSPRIFAFANPKGGVHKTTATVLSAAAAGSVRGRGVLAWDDNELRGTLGLRAGSARHARTIRHLVADLALIETSQGRELTDRLDDYLRHAADGSYDVLAGEESPRFAQRLDQFTVRRVIDLLRRSHEVICVDTGNNVESVNWQTVMRAADRLVITTVPREDAAFTADWMLDLLHESGMGELANNAMTLLSCPTPGQSPLLDDLRRHFATRTRHVAVVPYDPVLESGSSIEYSLLQPATRQAWLKAAAMMLEPFAR